MPSLSVDEETIRKPKPCRPYPKYWQQPSQQKKYQLTKRAQSQLPLFDRYSFYSASQVYLMQTKFSRINYYSIENSALITVLSAAMTKLKGHALEGQLIH
jgi:hypothetical protein